MRKSITLVFLSLAVLSLCKDDNKEPTDTDSKRETVSQMVSNYKNKMMDLHPLKKPTDKLIAVKRRYFPKKTLNMDRKDFLLPDERIQKNGGKLPADILAINNQNFFHVFGPIFVVKQEITKKVENQEHDLFMRTRLMRCEDEHSGLSGAKCTKIDDLDFQPYHHIYSPGSIYSYTSTENNVQCTIKQKLYVNTSKNLFICSKVNDSKY